MNRPILAFVLLCVPAHAATLAVLPGESIQAKVDAAAPGDIIAIFGGIYPGDVTITKAVRLVEVDGEEVTITGNVTWNGVTNAPPFEGFSVGSPGKGLTATATTGLVIKNVDTRNGFGLRIIGASEISVAGGFASRIDQDGGQLATCDISLTGEFSTTGNSVKTVAYRTIVSQSVTWNSKKAWFGYSSAKRFVFSGSQCQVVIVGSQIDSASVNWDAVLLQGSNNSYSVFNSIIKNVRHGDNSSDHPPHGWHSEPYPGNGISVAGVGNKANIVNNYIGMIRSSYLTDSNWGYAILCGNNSMVYNNLTSGARWGITAPFGADVRNNFHHDSLRGMDTGGVVPIGSMAGDPLFISGQTPKLNVLSPCVNAGVSDPLYNDLDGTRNDIGPGGGCLFDPDGWTTAKPVVIAFDLAPQQLLKGVDTQVTLSKGQAVAQP